MDQSTLEDDHFAYCYDKPRKTDVAKTHRHSVNEDDICTCGASAKELATKRIPFAAGALFYYFGDM